MAEAAADKKVISKANAGFPEWLDFEKMRREGMEYLGKLSGKLWTDHNAHDPGITILESLCYALLDLGYRTSLPAADLFARDPEDRSAENNFLTPAQILGCNPLTILDYRRLLIDIDGVRNAWLTVAEDITVNGICGRQQFFRAAPIAYSVYQPTRNTTSCKSFLNGLYHVYLEIEDDYRTETEKKKLIKTVKEVLMAHRNLCEDFYDITVLCTQDVGVCADIELRSGVDPAKVFSDVVKALREFLSPAPKFYRLKDLMDKGRHIEDIFAGRPYDLENSHGFVDTDEFEKIILQKEIHLSDIYNVLFAIEGVAAIRNISLRNCDGTVCEQRNPNGTIDPAKWIFKLYKDHVPKLNIACSGFRFTRNGHDLLFDYRSVNVSTTNSNKRRLDPKNLDLALPVGNYRKDLADYIQLENDFPKVYGITEGSLLSDVSDARKAQSLQLRGYLLFFDVLLSGYLTQLKNIRQLFSLNGSGGNNDHTYYSNRLTETDGLRKLLSLETVDSGTGSSLAFPVNRKGLENIIQNGQVDFCDIGVKIPPHQFNCNSEREIAIRQLIEDFVAGNFNEYLLTGKNGCWTFYLVTSSEQYVLLSRDQFKTEQGARMAIASLQYQLVAAKSYRRSNSTSPDRYSFTVAASQNNYWDYLQVLTENEQLYVQRRNAFLDHLLARFAETFTDYTLLSWSSKDEQQVQLGSISKKQEFLAAYPELSSTRGKAYDYHLNGWNNSNVSGFEKRVAAYAGMDSSGQQNLCHFEVLEYEEQSMVNIQWQNKTLFSSEHSFEGREEGKEAARSLLTAMRDISNYEVTEQYNKYELGVRAANTLFRYPAPLSGNQATMAKTQFSRMATPGAVEEDVKPSQFRHEITLEQNNTKNKWYRAQPVINREKELELSADLLSDFQDPEKWKADGTEQSARPSSFRMNPDDSSAFISTDGLHPYFNYVDVKGKSDIRQYTIRDDDKTFFFISEEEFDDDTSSEAGLTRLLFALADPTNYDVAQVSREECYIKVSINGKTIATNKIECDSEKVNEEIIRISELFRDRIYTLSSITHEDLYQYTLQLGTPLHGNFQFVSIKEFGDKKEAITEANRIALLPAGFSLNLADNKQLELKEKNKVLAVHQLNDPNNKPEGEKKAAEDLISLKRVFNEISLDLGSAETEKMVRPDPISAQGNFGYRLVKKDGYFAWYRLAGDYTDKKRKTDRIKEVFQYFSNPHKLLDICYGGDIIRERKDAKTNISWYHFQVKSVHGGFVLFESTKGYESAELAQLAFNKEYPGILTMAGIELNYGDLINYEEVFFHNNDSCADIRAIVFIPDETMRRFSYNHDAARQGLSVIARSYPIRTIKKSDPQFHEYFPCADIPGKPEQGCCCGDDEKEYYYFQLQGANEKEGQWISATWFETANEALKAFHFFLVLLKYRGNYFINYKQCDDTCSWRLYLREILTISSHRFKTAKEAWGENGVQRFICVSQTARSFNPYLHKDDCCYTFNVACGNMGLIHPCTYDSAAKRDAVMARLIQAAMRWAEDFRALRGPLWEEVNAKLEDIVIHSNRGTRNPCVTHQDLVDIINRSYNSPGQNEKDEAVKRYESLSPEKKTAVLELANNFPVTRREGSNKYYVEIRFPGICNEDHKAHRKEKDGCNECCCTAWVSECCFDTCKEALDYYYKVMQCLAEKNNYLPVFDCECGPYGIKFFCDCDDHSRPAPAPDANNPNRVNIPVEEKPARNGQCCNEIVAMNPNCYSYPKMACEAIDRAKRLINAEGLHLVEHILLRPHCRQDFNNPNASASEKDCECLINTCNTVEKCTFTWSIPGDDPCTMSGNDPLTWCFTPGVDPYSFIATVVLPAWPERFRKKENRALLEQMLYREVPSHVMLRVLWVTPEDLCRFESLYYNWTKWLACKTVCGDHNIPCDFIRFLFSKQVESQRMPAIWDCFTCNDCVPCDDTVTIPNPCNFDKEAGADPNAYVNAINRLYCWKEICPRPVVKIKLNLEDLTPMPVALSVDEQIEAEREIDRRFHAYHHEAFTISRQTGSEVAGEVYSFLKNPSPKMNDYQKVNDLIITNDIDKNGVALGFDDQKALARLATWYIIDLTLLNGVIEQHREGLEEEVAKLNENELLPEYKTWHERELVRMKAGLKIGAIRKLFK